MSLPRFDYARAPDLRSALAEVADGAIPIHGGTELLLAMDLGLSSPAKLVSIRGVEELRVCRREDGHLIVGAGLTHREIAANGTVRAGAPLLAEVCDGVGNIRVRSTGTIGGNLAFAEPRSDIATVLLALDSEVQLAALQSRRVVSLSSFLLGAYEVDLRPGELITSVLIPYAGADFGVYRKIVFSERPVVGVALVYLAARGRWRIAVGAVGLVPLVVEVDQLARLDVAAISAAIDVTSEPGASEEYKRHLTAVTIERCREAAESFESERPRT